MPLYTIIGTALGIFVICFMPAIRPAPPKDALAIIVLAGAATGFAMDLITKRVRFP